MNIINKTPLLGNILGWGLLLSMTSGPVVAEIASRPVVTQVMGQSNHETGHATEQTGQFQRIEQPLWLKGAVTVGGLGLVGLELWWFLLSKPKSRQATTQGEVQEVTITVDGGYEPSQIVVQAGQPVRLNFDRQDPSSCLEEVRFPDFHIAQALLLHQTTAIEFTPDKPGRYEFTCGMNMFRGVVEVRKSSI
ncbi:cupredoxin domain-containing protein [Trichocoleus desertorum AS-A10]|uniref:cupredoxin domain-containing protein n=1 Tax=Trichocoleus desertorum TaxID=1481672 RepID=UPI00329D3117